ncbi:ATP-dependent RNA helicase SUPV3L1 [Pyrus ussuriensis x Pyrus communis]|uniref:ATP-dependent RNA helicase SUPV3L1 n=1 Tax=Pyrus ussuriensis x Pyrus communis TaxID=2448454 RepID=A0A5N5HC41_9ROSA|nr:ATP-dependent RNA helicase SUPV3L1 [Pyrus ussuriensis x Pyrus communis]
MATSLILSRRFLAVDVSRTLQGIFFQTHLFFYRNMGFFFFAEKMLGKRQAPRSCCFLSFSCLIFHVLSYCSNSTCLAGNVGPSCMHLELKVTTLINVVDKKKIVYSPHTWYPKAQSKQCKVILHMGIRRIYCGHLRLLAWEVTKRLNKAKVPCDLIIGQERDEVDSAKHKVVTVEMAYVTSSYHCEIVDEIQASWFYYVYEKYIVLNIEKYYHLSEMLSCKTRGFSFTRALLGISADKLHLCGDQLSPLVPMKVPLGSFSNIKTGDCIATMINDASSEFDVLVARYAIGMGLNLNISRIIFSTMMKFDGFEMRELTVPEVKQIAGTVVRARRYGSKFPVGEVTCLNADDLSLLHSSLESQSPTFESAGLFPTFDLMYMYSRLHPECGLYQILKHFLQTAKLSTNYFIADCEVLKAATVIDVLPLRLHDKYLFCISLVDMDDEISSQGFMESLEVPKTEAALKKLESIHNVDRRHFGEVRMAKAENQEISLVYFFNFTIIPESQT